MLLIGHTLPADMPLCVPGHEPRLVEARGRPAGAAIAFRASTWWHVECHRCGTATVPCASRALAESRWRDEHTQHRIPITSIAQQRLSAMQRAA